MSRILAVLATIAVTLISGCVSPFRGPGGSGSTTGTSVGGKLYVSTTSSILRFGSALTANGNVAPEVTVTGGGISSPRRLLIDTSTDRLFVANGGGPSVLVFSTASKMTSSATPSAVLGGSSTNIVSPVDVAIDPTNNLLYVADGQNILVFTSESTLSGNTNTPPVRTVNFTFTITAIFLDVTNNILFIADSTDNTINIMASASTANGPGAVLLTGAINGTGTQLNGPNGVLRDNSGRVIVSNTGSPASITIYPSASVPSGGTVAPSAVITGSATKLTVPGQMAFNTNTGDLYVADTQAPGVLVFQNITSLNTTSNLAPGRSIIGSGTSLNSNAVNGLALDTTR